MWQCQNQYKSRRVWCHACAGGCLCFQLQLVLRLDSCAQSASLAKGACTSLQHDHVLSSHPTCADKGRPKTRTRTSAGTGWGESFANSSSQPEGADTGMRASSATFLLWGACGSRRGRIRRRARRRIAMSRRTRMRRTRMMKTRTNLTRAMMMRMMMRMRTKVKMTRTMARTRTRTTQRRMRMRSLIRGAMEAA
ncbi:hypothetical protein BOTBODRAFT_553337 [Botryobasidium botryosum FD-172 SS1]|uniref:Uncharacterized protein n=1 Tax=Botryobasidium botryosum (strain FD-172 SS1) TaxID=930990 RepID=A0A067MU20_BOTB1|nr:hypothetical protein BOTBODRAFT_553337 [Botryobasidium botryosum FD-172 SS1]